jgi:hypothetical protein
MRKTAQAAVWINPSSREEAMRLFVVVRGDEIIVTSETGFRAAYCKRPNHPQLKVRRRTETDDHELLAQAWQAANDKAQAGLFRDSLYAWTPSITIIA